MAMKLEGMALISFVWLVSASACIGLSMLVNRALRGASGWHLPLLDHFWIGLSIVFAALQVTSLLAPINGLAAMVVLLVGLTGLVLGFGRIREQVSFADRFSLLQLLATPLFALWLANQAMAAIQTYDAGLYHTSAIRWAFSLPVTRGLGNLQPHLASNSSYFLYHALFVDTPLIAGSFNVGSGLLILMLTLQAATSVVKVLRRDRALAPCDLMLVAAVPVVANTWFNDAASTSPDLPALVLVTLIGFYMWRLFGEVHQSRQGRESFFILTLLSAVAITVKLSTLAFAGSAVFISALEYTRRDANATAVHIRDNTLLILVACIAVCLLPWIVRGYLLSGYPFFPAHFGRADWPWSMAVEGAKTAQTTIRTWSRQRGATIGALGAWTWIGPWWDRVRSDFQFPYQLGIPAILATFGAALLAMRFRPSPFRSAYGRSLMLLIPPVVSLVAWWILAPDPRFLAGAPWYLATSAILIGLTNLDFPAAKRFSSWVLVLSLVLALPIVITSDKFIPPGPQNGFFPLPGVETTAFVTTGGLTLQVPTGGDQCWGSSLLCTPSPDLNLTLLSDGDLQSGFAVVQSDK